MFKIIWSSLKKPQLLLQATLLPKSFIFKLITMLSLIISIPTIVTEIDMISKLQQDIQTISAKLPQFNSQQGILTSQTHQKSQAIQTDTTYFLYDIENKVDYSNKVKLKENNMLSIFLTKTSFSIYALKNHLFSLSIKDNQPFTTQSVQQQLSEFIEPLHILYFLVPILTVLMNGLLLAANMLLFAFVSNLSFLIRQKKIRYKHLFRVSLILSFFPYSLFSIFALFHAVIPFQTIFLGLFIIVGQHLVLKDVISE